MSGPETPGDAPVRAPFADGPDDIDMTGVDPLRWEEVRRRVDVVRRYLRIPSPSAEDQQTHATALGLSINQFMALVRAWREHRSAARMAGSGSHRGATRQPSRLAVPTAAKEEAGKVIREMGPNAPLVDIVRRVAARCEALGVASPSRSTLWNMLTASRQVLGDRNGGDPRIVVGTCEVRLPMAVAEGVGFSRITLAVRAADGAILAAGLGDADWQATIKAIAAASGFDEPVRADKALLPQKRADSIRAGIEPVPAAKARSRMSRILGAGIDDVRLIYRPSKAISPQRLLTTSEDRPLSPGDVRRIVTAAVARHNAARGAGDATWIDLLNASTAASGV